VRARRDLAILSAALAVACSSSAKRETASLSSEVDRYRRADNASKQAQESAVAAVACSDAKVCEAKAACLAALTPTTRALLLKDEVARRLVDLESKRLSPDSPDAQALPGKLDDAQKLLVEGRAKMADCDRKLADLRILYGV